MLTRNLLPRGWAVEVIPLTVGIRGSLHDSEPCWLEILDRFGISSLGTQSRFLQELLDPEPGWHWRSLTERILRVRPPQALLRGKLHIGEALHKLHIR